MSLRPGKESWENGKGTRESHWREKGEEPEGCRKEIREGGKLDSRMELGGLDIIPLSPPCSSVVWISVFWCE